MIDRTLRGLIVLAAITPFLRTTRLGAEPLPPRALARIGDHRFYHGPGITCVALSPDGRRAASAAREAKEDDLDDQGPSISDPLIVFLWDVSTGKRLHELHVPEGVVTRLAFSPDGKSLAASYETSEEISGVVLFDVETGEVLRRLSEFPAQIAYLQFSSNGKQLWVSEWRGPVRAWDVATIAQLHVWKPPPSTPPCKEEPGICAVKGVLSPDGRLIAWEMGGYSGGGCPSSWMEGFRILDVQTNKLLFQRKFRGNEDEGRVHNEFRWSFTFTSDGKRLVADCDKIVVLEATTGKELVSFQVPGMIRCAVSPDGKRAVIEEGANSGEKSCLRLWDIDSGKPIRVLFSRVREVGPGRVGVLPVFSADGKTLLAATNSTLRFFDARTGKERSAPGHHAPVTPWFSADGRTLITTCAEKRCRWSVSGKQLTLLGQQPRKAWEFECLAQSSDGQLLLDQSPRSDFRVRDTATGCVLHTFSADADSAVFSPDATRVLLYDERNDRLCNFPLHDVKTGKKSGEIKDVALCGQPVFSPNGRLLAWPDRVGDIHLHDAVTGKSVRTLRQSLPRPKEDNGFYCFRLLFSPDGERLVTTNYYMDGSAQQIRLPFRVLQISSGKQLASFSGDATEASKSTSISCMACSPDGRLLAFAERQSDVVRVLELGSAKTRVVFSGHRDGVHGLAFSPDGKTLSSGGEDNVVFLWDVLGIKTIEAKPERSTNLAALWNDLASEDAKCAGVAIAALLRAPDRSMAVLQVRLHPAEQIDEKRIAQWIADLDSDIFATREKASQELFLLGERAEGALCRALKNRTSLELRRRVQDLLQKLEVGQLPLETLRTLRAIEVLEHIGTRVARDFLETLAKGATGAEETREAKAALRRLADRK